MLKKCENCGNTFEAREEYYKLCNECNKKRQYNKGESKEELPLNLLLKTYFDEKGDLVKEIFLDIPEQLAKKFYQNGLRMKQLRDFYHVISAARTSALLKGMAAVRPSLWQCITKLEYQLKRGIVPKSFVSFMKHHLVLAERDEKYLDAFYQHLDSIVCYFPKQ